MSQSLSQLNVHIIFHVKHPEVTIRSLDKRRLYSYIHTIIINTGCVSLEIGGTSDHIHILCVLSKNTTLVKLIEEIKRSSSKWIKTIDDHYHSFAWQKGYGAFAVSASICGRTKEYIKNQEKHHHKVGFREEYILFLKEYGIDYDENYLWRD